MKKLLAILLALSLVLALAVPTVAADEYQVLYSVDADNNGTIIADGLEITEGWYQAILTQYMKGDAVAALKSAMIRDNALLRVTYTGDSNVGVLLQSYPLTDGSNYPWSDYTVADVAEEGDVKVALFDCAAMIAKYEATAHPDDETGNTFCSFDNIMNFSLSGNGNVITAIEVVVAKAANKPAFNPEVVVFESEAGESFNCVNPWDGFGIGEVAVNGQSAGSISLAEIKDIVADGGATFNMIISGTGVWGAASPAPQAHFNAWALPVYNESGERYDGDDEDTELDTAECEMNMNVYATDDGKYEASIKLDDLLALFTSSKFNMTADDITNFAIQVYTGDFKLYKAWFELPEPAPEVEISDEQVYQAIEKQIGSLDGVSGDQQVMPIGDTVNTGETVVLRFTGTSDGPFRYWLSQGTWTSKSAITTVDQTEFDMLVEVTATADGANEVQFKGPAGGSLNNLTLTYVGIFKGTMTEYEEAFAAKKAELIEEALKAQGAGKYTGYLSTGDDYHMVIINNAVITTPHEYDDANICVYCGHVGTADDEIIIEVTDPVESTTDEEEDVTVDVEEPVEDEEPAVEENPKTGLALAIVPMIVAAAAVVISKR